MHSVAVCARLRALRSGQSVLDQTQLKSVPILGRNNSIMLERKSIKHHQHYYSYVPFQIFPNMDCRCCRGSCGWDGNHHTVAPVAVFTAKTQTKQSHKPSTHIGIIHPQSRSLCQTSVIMRRLKAGNIR
jgi:hypothetical protein